MITKNIPGASQHDSDRSNPGSDEPDLGRLLTDKQVIEELGIQDRKNPKGSLEWLRRSKQLGYVRIGRGIYGYPEAEVARFKQKRYVAPFDCRGT